MRPVCPYLGRLAASAAAFVLCAVLCIFNRDVLGRPLFQAKTPITSPLSASFEEDGFIYVIDSGSLRLFSMTPAGRMVREFTAHATNKFKNFEKIIDCAADRAGNLYIWFQAFDYQPGGTKTDSLRMYDREGNFIQEILPPAYAVPRTGGLYNLAPSTAMDLRSGFLAFSRLTGYGAELFRYNTATGKLDRRELGSPEEPVDLRSVWFRDFDNYAYITREGALYEAAGGGPPRQAAAFSFSPREGGVIPASIKRDDAGRLLFLDLVSGRVCSLDENGAVQPRVPDREVLKKKDRERVNTEGSGSFDGRGGKIAGVFNGQVWFYDGQGLFTYDDGVELPTHLRLRIILAQTSLVLGILALGFLFYFIHACVLKYYPPVFLKLAAAALALIVIAAVVALIGHRMLYDSMTGIKREELDQRILFLTDRVAEEIQEIESGSEKSLFEKITGTGDYQSASYAALVAKMKKTARYKGAEYYAVVLRFIDGEEGEGKTLSYIGDSMNEALLFVPCRKNCRVTAEADPAFYRLLHEGVSYAGLRVDSGGYWAYGRQVIDSGEEGEIILELGVDATYREMENRRLSQAIAIRLSWICLVVLAAVGGVLAFMAHRLWRDMGNRQGGGRPRQGQNELDTMSAQIDSYVKDLSKMTAERDRLDNELEMAAQIQNDMLPPVSKLTALRNDISLYAKMETAREVGGDFYDFFFLDKAQTRVGIVIADVSGKGMPASLLMVVAKTLIKRAMLSSEDLVETMRDLNRVLFDDNPRSMFVTVFLLSLDLTTGIMRYVNGGHNPPLISIGGEPYEYMQLDQNLPLGLFENNDYTLCTLQLRPGDRMYLYTDGLTEAMAPGGKQFGTHRLLEAANRYHDKPPEPFDKAIRAEVRSFTGDTHITDDMTSVAVLYIGKVKETEAPGSQYENVLVLLARISELDRLLDWIAGIMESAPWPAAAANQLCVACEEMFVNIANYAYPKDVPESERQVIVSFNFSGRTAALRFEDSGIPFDPLEMMVPDLTVKLEDRPLGGLGIYFVRTWMAEVTYERSGAKNILTLVKSI